MRGRAAVSIELNEDERAFLEAQVRRHKAARSLSDRCRIVLKCADGLSNKEIASVLGHGEHTVGKWRNRFAQHRIAGLSDEYRAGRPRTVSDELDLSRFRSGQVLMLSGLPFESHGAFPAQG